MKHEVGVLQGQVSGVRVKDRVRLELETSEKAIRKEMPSPQRAGCCTGHAGGKKGRSETYL